MAIIKKAAKILEQHVCDHCLGRQFAQLMHGYSNDERGQMIRTVVAMGMDKETKEVPIFDMSNFYALKFHNLEARPQKKKKCTICGDFFDSLDTWVDKIIKISKDYKFKTLLVGTKLSHELIMKEEELWERVGIDYCEPLKAEINRELGKLLEKRIKARCNLKSPDITFILDIGNNKVAVDINSLFIYGEYQKLKAGIPQTRWPSGKYKTSVEQIIAKPFMAATGGKGHKLHGLGREDIDARCLGWRPFVLELLAPKKREIKLSMLGKKIGKAVRVRGLRLSDIAEVRKIKETRLDKTYRAIIACEKPIKKAELKKLDILGAIEQKTPKRVLHRRSDKLRRRAVRSIRTKFISNKKFELTVKGEAGLYIKELISGDEGRTVPSVSSLLGVPCVCKKLDVMEIHRK